MSELIVAPAARADLLAQWDFYADEAGRPDLGDRFFACAEVTFEKLGRTPDHTMALMFGRGHPESASFSLFSCLLRASA